MDDREIKEKVLEIFSQEARLDMDSLSLETKIDDLGIESLDMVQILFGIEDTFDVYVPQDDDSFKLETVQDVVDGVKRLIKEQDVA